MRSDYDATYGGFGEAPKFPRPVALEYLMRYSLRGKNKESLDMALHTLDAMARGGMHDQLGGGFHRYTTDAQRARSPFPRRCFTTKRNWRWLIYAFQITHNNAYAATTRDTLFACMKCGAPGGFYSALDADSPLPGKNQQNGEGAYYVWSAAEVKKLLGSADTPPFEYRYGVQPDGNVSAPQDIEDKMRGMNVLYQQHSVAETASNFKTAEQAMGQQLNRDREELLRARTLRSHPPVDTKVITAWNGMLISALARSGLVLHEPRYFEAALRAGSMIETHLYSRETGQLKRRYRLGAAEVDGFLSDYANMVQGCSTSGERPSICGG
jgi:uncharacterized protein YyaL (SSP411 family)